MKTTSNLRGLIVSTCLAFAVAGVVWTPDAALAQQKGAEKLVQMYPLKTVKDLQTVEAGDTIVMSCPKCKESTASVVEKSLKGSKPEELKNVTIHLCPTCDTKIVAIGHGKAKTDKLVHTCKTCGSKDVFCCVMKKSGQSTQGMDQK